MGVDFPHVKYVINFGPGRTLTDHLQQAGRAGRDSQFAHNIILYQGEHLSQCEPHVKDVIRKKDCVRKMLLCHFTEDESYTVPIMHDCCNRCHLSCKCEGDHCPKEFVFDKVMEAKHVLETRDVSKEDKECLKQALQEIQLTLDFTSGITLFDVSGRIAHGFSNSIIDSIVDNSKYIFSVGDLMEYGLISSLRIGIMVLEVLNEIFEDIVIPSDLYRLAVLSSSVYNTVIDAASEYTESSNSD